MREKRRQKKPSQAGRNKGKGQKKGNEKKIPLDSY